ncbi:MULTISPECIES: hypothetical protein [Legionella]|uniref:Uncharacterized protein n=1 Tax=Legionella maceachernii TaxID=466 RepID=A0A0W0VYB1_9GAMM|nr:hypothetical protein [Legionella maceachernii]KTD25080.1 hypothetical protein Lmac_2058 [Legionella maceachernii]SKA31137.1 hypothetical protein SAMN02745128_03251 [Legionella maceachernii]SUP03645.1 Uncharacterised protein [Legionella maceachernii]
MFNELYHYLRNMKKEFDKKYAGASLQVLERAIFNEKEDRGESTDPSKYDADITLKYRIRLILLHELYCEKMPSEVTRNSLKKWRELEEDYADLEKTLCHEAETILGGESEDTLQSEIRKLEAYIQKTGLEANEKEEIYQDLSGKSSISDFLKLFAEVKRGNLSVSLRESQDCINFLTQTCEALVDKIEKKERKLSLLKENATKLNDEKRTLEKSFTWLERWAFEDLNGSANAFKRFVLWVYNLFPSQTIQDRSLILGRQVKEAYSAYTENTKNIDGVESDIKELKSHLKSHTKELDEAKKRNTNALKFTTPQNEPTSRETETNELEFRSRGLH